MPSIPISSLSNFKKGMTLRVIDILNNAQQYITNIAMYSYHYKSFYSKTNNRALIVDSCSKFIIDFDMLTVTRILNDEDKEETWKEIFSAKRYHDNFEQIVGDYIVRRNGVSIYAEKPHNRQQILELKGTVWICNIADIKTLIIGNTSQMTVIKSANN